MKTLFAKTVSSRLIPLLGILFSIVYAMDHAQAQQAQHAAVLLTNQSVLVGELAQEQNGYRIRTQNGISITIATSEIAAICDSIDGVYQLKKSAIKDNDSQAHLNLAQWCLKYKLLDRAKEQAYSARRLIGSSPSVLSIEKQVRWLENQSSKSQQASAKNPGPSKTVNDSKHDSERPKQLTSRELEKAIKMVPQPILEQFTKFVQPQLVTGCTVSGCHTNTETEFVLQRRSLHGRIPRRMTQRNIVNLIGRLNEEAQLDSELLTMATTQHGSMKNSAWSPDSRNAQILANWINAVKQQSIKIELNKNSRDSVGLSNDRRNASDLDQPPIIARQNKTEGTDFVPTLPSNEKTNRTSHKVDPFDPNEFNRRYGKMRKR